MRRKLRFLAGVAGEVGIDWIISQNEPKLAGIGAVGDGDLLDFDLGCFGGAAFGLDFAELFESAVELSGESRLVCAEGGEGAGLLDEGFGGSWGEEGGFKGGDAVEAPGGGGERVDELFFESAEGLEILEEAAAVGLVGGGVFGGQEVGVAGEAVAAGVEG